MSRGAASQPVSQPDRRRRTFGPVVLLGLAGAALAAVAGSKPWAQIAEDAPELARAAVSESAGEMPVAAALALVVLASWGVVLVTRGRVRRAVAVLGALAAAGTLAAAVAGWWQTVEPLEDALAQIGLGEATIEHTGWYWAGLAGAALALVAGVLAVRWCPGWPEMGTRYDAPTGAGAAASGTEVAPERRDNLDLWKSMDEGDDPTA